MAQRVGVSNKRGSVDVGLQRSNRIWRGDILNANDDNESDHGFVYFSSPIIPERYQGCLHHFSFPTYNSMMAVKVGCYKRDSYNNSSDGLAGRNRTSHNDVGCFITHSHEQIQVPKGCELKVEKLIHELLANYHVIGEHHHISKLGIKMLSDLVISNDSAFGIPFDVLLQNDHYSDVCRDHQRVFFRTNELGLENLVVELNSHLNSITQHRPEPLRVSLDVASEFISSPSLDIRTPTKNAFTFTLANADSVKFCKEIESYNYCCSPVFGDFSSTPHDAMLLWAVKMGKVTDQTPAERLNTLQVGSSFVLQMTCVKAKNKTQAETQENKLHKLYQPNRMTREWYFLHPDAQRDVVKFLMNAEIPHPSNKLHMKYQSPVENFVHSLLRSSNLRESALTLPELRSNGNVMLNYQSLRCNDWILVLRVLIAICKWNENDEHFTGAELVKQAKSHPLLAHLFMYGSMDFLPRQFETWFPKILGFELKDLRKSRSPGKMICDKLSSNGEIKELKYDTLHSHWWLFIRLCHTMSNKNTWGVSR
mmetsp:Transcript_7298/g.11496  ORF Transcript_7298/g.11496 Transcript_7298/m.11496 type:complete len:536 (+) Transcript_7298:2172-3779(+)|eukprot:CAMPEP_0201719666 /NCGR_PEP_ID=MMETSP0593-20130828/4821_1 /ASSEMBLY_ACC=CAM_ASM_000672 /TAXON_ID=267983 /ORGANISM="Skeletonema japonicum, Strain CCMP2506" /LENGTH=535 /DNA_ID=CAMNT_0048210165 /DNA_START=51 /DNA_END=1658 /DNA_ORIENTATION=+